MPIDLKKTKLHFHADDFGLLPQGDAAILELLAAGRLHGTSVMINRVSAESLRRLRQLKQQREIFLGLHLDAHDALSSEINIAKEERLSFILVQGIRLTCSRRLRQQARRIWENQLLQFREKFGSFPDQLEAHQHRNFHPWLFPIICDLAIKYKIPKVRVGQKTTPWRYWRSCPRAYVINSLLWLNRHQKKFREVVRHCSTTHYIFSLDWIFPAAADRKTLQALQSLAKFPTEIILHPAKPLPDHQEYAFLPERYQQYRFLRDRIN